MASYEYHYRRDSTSSEASIRRPRVPRASVTRPSITTQNAIRESLAAPRSPERATDILSKVFLAPVLSAIGQKAPDMLRHHMMMGHRSRESSPESQSVHEMEDSHSGCYFSFPSFENWDEPKDDESREVFG